MNHGTPSKTAITIDGNNHAGVGDEGDENPHNHPPHRPFPCDIFTKERDNITTILTLKMFK